MSDLISYLKKHNNRFEKAPKVETLIFAQKTLASLGLCSLPQEMATFLNDVNVFCAEDTRIYGICPHPDETLDIVNANVFWKFFTKGKSLVLAENDFDILLYVPENSCYQIVDKQDGDVLEVYSTLEKALYAILKF